MWLRRSLPAEAHVLANVCVCSVHIVEPARESLSSVKLCDSLIKEEGILLHESTGDVGDFPSC